jgi:hypothetical protein
MSIADQRFSCCIASHALHLISPSDVAPALPELQGNILQTSGPSHRANGDPALTTTAFWSNATMATDKDTIDRAHLEAQRHAELCEGLWRISTALEASYQLQERQLRAMTSLEARIEGALQYFIRAW